MRLEYVVTSHDGMDGVRLSRPGHWGNFPFPDEDAALEAARISADGHPYRVAREHFPALPRTRPPRTLER